MLNEAKSQTKKSLEDMRVSHMFIENYQIDKNNYINNIVPNISENVYTKELPKIEVTYFEENSYINNEQLKITNTIKNDEIIYYIDENMRLFDKNIYFLDDLDEANVKLSLGKAKTIKLIAQKIIGKYPNRYPTDRQPFHQR